MHMITLWLEFIACSAAILYSGTMLSKYGDVIAEKSGLGRMWIGVILMALVTSLPELINNVSSVTIAGVPDIALGDIMGSCVFNIFIIAVMDFMQGRGSIFRSADTGHELTAGFGIVLIGMVLFFKLAEGVFPALGTIGLYTPIIIILYFAAVRSTFRFEKKKAVARKETAVIRNYDHVSTREGVVKYALNAAVIIAAATFLPFIGGSIAAQTGLGKTFVGASFIALTTSLPELVVSAAALRIGAADLAIGNIFGSNLFNILIIAVGDIFYIKGPLLRDVSTNHVITGVIAVMMTAIAITGLTYRSKKKTAAGISWEAASLTVLFLTNLFVLYAMRGTG
ncbi:MAG: sodium:calcium antiporter [Thermodesulfobacteriota bacterium]